MKNRNRITSKNTPPKVWLKLWGKRIWKEFRQHTSGFDVEDFRTSVDERNELASGMNGNQGAF